MNNQGFSQCPHDRCPYGPCTQMHSSQPAHRNERHFTIVDRSRGCLSTPANSTEIRQAMRINQVLNPESTSSDRAPGSSNHLPHSRRFSSESTSITHGSIQEFRSSQSPLGSVCGSPRERQRCTNNSGKVRKGKPTGPRLAYTIEEGIAIWYLRTDLALSWEQVDYWFKQWFGRVRREKSGLQCKFYRCEQPRLKYSTLMTFADTICRVIGSWEVDTVRVQNRHSLRERCTVEDDREDHEKWTAAYRAIVSFSQQRFS
jgi:hypothetical protein